MMRYRVGQRVMSKISGDHGSVNYVHDNGELDVLFDGRPRVVCYLPSRWVAHESLGERAEVHAGPTWGVR